MLYVSAFIGASKNRGGSPSGATKRSRTDKEVSEEEEIIPDKLTRRQQSAQAKAVAAKKFVKKTASLAKMPPTQFIKERRVNPYATTKDSRYKNPLFHTQFQERIYHEVLPRFKTKIVKQFCINTEYMQAHRDYFGEALDMCEEFGILQHINLHENFQEALIHQFYATVHFATDQRSITWMSKDKVLSSSWADFASLLGMRDY